MNAQELNQIMQDRKIYDVITEWGWQPCQHHNNRWGWYIPIQEGFGRWKAGDGEKPKYLWQPHKPLDAKAYYIPTPCAFAIADKGAVVFCEGETDMAALYAIGVHNVACWYDGAKSIPETIVEDVKAWGCAKVTFIPDYDKTGLEAGIKFYELFQNTDIAVYIRKIPNGFNDVNDCLMAGVISPTKNSIGVWDIQELRDTLQMMQGEITERQNTPLNRTDTHEINERVADALLNAALAQGGKPQRHKGHLAIPVLAPRMLGHKRDSVGQHAYFYPDACLVFDYAKRATVKGLQLCQEWGIDYRALGGWYKEGYKPASPTHSQQWQGVEFEAEPPFELPAVPTPDGIIQSRRQLLEEQRHYLTNPKAHGQRAILNPMLCLRGFGGFGELLGIGKVMLLGLPSGGGKTVSVEMMIEQCLKDGYNVLLWGGEWTNEEYAQRAIQQNGGATLNDFYRDSALRDWAENGGKRNEALKPIIHDVKQASLAAIDKLQSIPNDVFYFNAKYSSMDLENTLKIMGGSIIPNKIDLVVWDYAQLRPKSSDGYDNSAQAAFDAFKAFCIDHGVPGIMTSQVNKTATDNVENGSGLNASDFNGIRIDRANLAVAAWRVVVGIEELPLMFIRILKNNLGGKGNCYILLDSMASLRVDFSRVQPKEVAEGMIERSKHEQGIVNGKGKGIPEPK